MMAWRVLFTDRDLGHTQPLPLIGYIINDSYKAHTINTWRGGLWQAVGSWWPYTM